MENNNKIDFDENKPYLAPHNPFTLEGHFQPWYDDRKDYNTNAPTYFDYLANFNHLIKSIVDLLNRVARRNIKVEDTPCIDMTKINDWIDEGNECHTYHDVITLKADVVLSTYQKILQFDGKQYSLSNAISCLSTGLYASDYLPILEALKDKLNKEIGDRIEGDDELNRKIEQVKNELQQAIDNLRQEFNNYKQVNNAEISKLKTEITHINGRIDGLTKFASATIQPPLKVIEFNATSKIEDNSTNPPNKRKGIDFSSIRVEYEKDKFRTYEYFKVGLAGYNLNNVQNGDVIAELPITQAMASGMSASLILQAYTYTWTISTGYTTNNSFNQIAFGISATSNPENDTSGKVQIKVLKFEGASPISGIVNEDNTNHVIVNVYDN